ncbi:hypothetical protein [Paenibacillus chitinolyticus]|nr:hypothetical protein [Paenibacillus chitinolyticus]
MPAVSFQNQMGAQCADSRKACTQADFSIPDEKQYDQQNQI